MSDGRVRDNRAKSLGGSTGLDALIRAAEPGINRPVDTWDPPYCGDIGLAIVRDGTWLYQGSPIGRIALVKLFSSILRKDADGRTYVVTPAEKVDVAIEDAPFLAVELAVTGAGEQQSLTFRTNVDDVVTVSADHPLRFAEQPSSGGLKPYVLVRGRLEALATRSVYAELAQLAMAGGKAEQTGVWSGGIFWPMGAATGALNY